MHDWSDESFDWNEFSKVEDFFYSRAQQYRIAGQIKEKYGTLRWYAYLTPLSLHDIFWPGHMFLRWQQPAAWKWYLRWLSPIIGEALKYFDIYVFSNWTWFAKKSQEWKVKGYVKAYEEAAKRWPQFKDEIFMMADQHELLGHLFPFEDHWTTYGK